MPSTSCTPATAMPPSPTAAAQRFTEPERTSPAAKIPGRLVSSGPGERLAPFHRGCIGDRVAGLDEALCIALDLGRQPVGTWPCANHGKDGRRLDGAPLMRAGVLQLGGFKGPFAHHPADLSVRQNFDILPCLNPPRQIAGHAFRQPLAADHQQRLSPRVRRETSLLAQPSCRPRRQSPSSRGRAALPGPWPRNKPRTLQTPRAPRPPTDGNRPPSR